MADIQYAGEYIIEECKLLTVGGLELDLIDLVASVDIYEDIFQNSISGDISFADTNDVIGNARICGQEKLKLKLSTPNVDDTDDRNVVINFTEQPLYIYKINSKVNVNDKTVAFSLSFTTAELVRNNNIRVVQSFSGEPSAEIIKNILRDTELLNSKKEFYYEETSNKFKLVAPNMRPFQFINALARRCTSNEYDYAPTFLFYETVKGYFFRTLDSMMDRKNPRLVYRELTANEEEIRARPDLLLQNILDYDVVSTTNTLASRRSGMYASKLYLLDIFNKDYKEYDYDYLEDFDRDVHVDQFNRYGSEKGPAVSESLDDYNKKITEYPDATVYLQTIDRDIPDGLFNPAYTETYDYMGTDKWLQRRKSRFASLNSAVSLRLSVSGNTTLQAGDLIGVVIKDKLNDEDDQTLTGKYLVSKLHHTFKRGEGLYKHEILMDCVRDTVQTKYPSKGVIHTDGGSSTDELIPRGDADPGEIIF